MTIEIGNLIKSLESDIVALNKSVKDKQQLVVLLKKECVHKWEYSHTCGHKREDYNICIYCGEIR